MITSDIFFLKIRDLFWHTSVSYRSRGRRICEMYSENVVVVVFAYCILAAAIKLYFLSPCVRPSVCRVWPLASAWLFPCWLSLDLLSYRERAICFLTASSYSSFSLSLNFICSSFLSQLSWTRTVQKSEAKTVFYFLNFCKQKGVTQKIDSRQDAEQVSLSIQCVVFSPFCACIAGLIYVRSRSTVILTQSEIDRLRKGGEYYFPIDQKGSILSSV